MGPIVWGRGLVEESGIFHFMLGGWVNLLTMFDTLFYQTDSHGGPRDANRITTHGS